MGSSSLKIRSAGGRARNQKFHKCGWKMVGPNGLEPLTSTVSRWRSSQLSYGPTDLPDILTQGLDGFASYLFVRGLGAQWAWAFTTWPPFITNCTFSSTWTFVIGSPSTAIRSANLPGSSVPTLSAQPIRSDAFTVPA
jgi:hypothetical protein